HWTAVRNVRCLRVVQPAQGHSRRGPQDCAQDNRTMNGERSGDTVTRGMRITDQGVSEQWKQRYKQARSRLATLLRRRLTASRTPNEILTRVPLPFDVVVHFADSPINLYQIRQWLHPLEQLNERHPV